MAARYILLVEGDDDAHVLKNLGERREYKISLRIEEDAPDSIKIEKKGGFPKILEELPVRLKGDGELERLGIILDADTNLTTRWGEVRKILIGAGYVSVPATPESNGTVIEQAELPIPVVGIWLMPENTLPGMLEDFIAFLVPSGNTLWEYAKECVDKIPKDERLFIETHLGKAYIHTWLAWQKDCGTPLGWAITKRYLDPGANNARLLMDWVRRLYGLA